MAEPKVKDWYGDIGDTEAVMEKWSQAAGGTVHRLIITRLPSGKHSVTCELSPDWERREADAGSVTARG